MTEEEFKSLLKKASGPRVHKITNSLGVYDAYKYIRKNKWFDIGRPLTEKEFYSIIRKVNLLIADALSLNKEIVLPCKMGTIELRKEFKRLKIVDGKLVTNLPVNWDETLKLWYEDEECYNKRTLVRYESQEVFGLVYKKFKANYKNKIFYQFRAGRNLKLKITKNAREGTLDAYLISKYHDKD